MSDEMKKALVACVHDLKKQGVEGNQKLKMYVRDLRTALREAEMMVKNVSLVKSEIKNGKVEYREI